MFDDLEENFKAEIANYREGRAYNAETIAEHLQVRIVEFQANDSEENCKALVDDAIVSIMPLLRYVREQETSRSTYQAVYIAASNRKRESEDEARFWHGLFVGVCAMVVIYMMGRAVMWLWPSICEIWQRWFG